MIDRKIEENLLGVKTDLDRKFADEIREMMKREKDTEVPANLKGKIEYDDLSWFVPERCYINTESMQLLNKIINRHKMTEKLAELKIRAADATLIYGPPGTGKTNFARYVSYKTKLPLYKINIANTITSLLGDTCKAIDNVFNFINTKECILLLDEVDSIAQKRGTSQEVGEMKRAVITVMNCLDNMQQNSILIACTNRFDILDPAFTRRMTFVQEFGTPSADDLKQACRMFLESVGMENNVFPTDIIKNAKNYSDLYNNIVEYISAKVQ